MEIIATKCTAEQIEDDIIDMEVDIQDEDFFAQGGE